MNFTENRKTLLLFFLGSYGIVLALSAIRPTYWFSYWADNIPAILVVCFLVITYRKFPFTPLAYLLLWIAVILVAIGAHYAYEEVPLFNWIREPMGFRRNHYDRFVHLFQGFAISLVMREILVRRTTGIRQLGLAILSIFITLALSALYEISEFAVAIATGKKASLFLGTQGDVWDTQWDMTFNLTGAILAMLLLSKLHNRLLNRDL